MRNTGLEEAQARIKIAKRSINNLRYAYDWYASLIAQLVKNLLAMQETPLWLVGQEDLLEKK